MIAEEENKYKKNKMKCANANIAFLQQQQQQRRRRQTNNELFMHTHASSFSLTNGIKGLFYSVKFCCVSNVVQSKTSRLKLIFFLFLSFALFWHRNLFLLIDFILFFKTPSI